MRCLNVFIADLSGPTKGVYKLSEVAPPELKIMNYFIIRFLNIKGNIQDSELEYYYNFVKNELNLNYRQVNDMKTHMRLILPNKCSSNEGVYNSGIGFAEKLEQACSGDSEFLQQVLNFLLEISQLKGPINEEEKRFIKEVEFIFNIKNYSNESINRYANIKIKDQYSNMSEYDLIKNMEISREIKPISLRLILGDESFQFYERYLFDINTIIVEMMKNNGIINKVDFNKYYEYAFKLLISFFYDDNKNKVVLENYFNAISILMNTDDINKIIETTVVTIYDSYYYQSG